MSVDIQHRCDSASKSLDQEWASWIENMARGDEAALRVLYSAAVSHVYGLALRITHNAAAAEEVVGEVFYQVWRTAASFDPLRGSPLCWLRIICRSVALKKNRLSNRAIAFDDWDSMEALLIDESSNPQSLLLASERHALVHQVLQSLNDQERYLLGLAFFHDLSYSEIAQHTAMPLGTVKTKIRRALQTLRKRLNGLDQGDSHESR